MGKYEYGRIDKLAQNLEKAGINQVIIDQIMEGGKLYAKAQHRKRKPNG